MLCAQYAELLLAQHPGYPTPEHLVALDSVARLVLSGMAYGNHHGCPRPEDVGAGHALLSSVGFSSGALRINVYAQAP